MRIWHPARPSRTRIAISEMEIICIRRLVSMLRAHGCTVQGELFAIGMSGAITTHSHTYYFMINAKYVD